MKTNATIARQPLQFQFCVPPGETLQEVLDSLAISQKELARRTGINVQTINRIIKGNAPISAETADCLAYVTQMPARFWLKLEHAYREALHHENLKRDADKIPAKAFVSGFPYKELAARHLCPDTRNYSQRREALLQFFGVAGEQEFERTYIDLINGAARVGSSSSWNAKSFAAWLRIGELAALKIDTADYSVDALKTAIHQIRSLVTQEPAHVWPQVQQLLSSAGVAAVLVKELKDTHVFGYSRFIRPGKAIVQLSNRGGRVGTFWFNLFHELGHLLLHSKKKVFINQDSPTKGKKDHAQTDSEELAANRFSRDTLIPPTPWRNFLSTTTSFTKDSIQNFAGQMNVAFDIVLGRLQAEGKIPYTHFPHQVQRTNDMPFAIPSLLTYIEN